MNKVKVVAEIGCNHQGSLNIAKEMIAEAKRCGCDFVKFQKRNISRISKEKFYAPYISEHSFGKTYGEHRISLEFNEEQWLELKSFCKKEEIGFFGTAFDYESAILLSQLDTPYIKIGSGQIRDLEYLKQVKKILSLPPIIMSTGMCDLSQVGEAVKILEPSIICQSTSSYPCPESEVNIDVLNQYSSLFFNGKVEFGLSGHYIAGNGAIEAAAVALEATYIERHFTLDRTWKGTDQSASLEPLGMMNVVKAIRTVEKALGNGVKTVMPSEEICLAKNR